MKTARLVFGLLLAIGTSAASADSGNNDNVTLSKSHAEQVTVTKSPSVSRQRHANHADTWVDNVSMEALTDLNGNGYASRFAITFDADTVFAEHRVVAELRLDDGHQQWLYFTSDPIVLNGTRGDDAYRVTTTLSDNYATGVYAVTITLYDAQSGAVLNRATSYQFPALHALYLESSTLDSQQVSTAYLDYHRVSLFNNLDESGYFSSLTLQVDVDYPGRDAWLAVNLWLDIPGSGWYRVVRSEPFRVSGVSGADQQDMTVDLDSGYPAHHYRYKLQVVDIDSGLIMDEFLAEPDAYLALQSRDVADRGHGHHHDEHYDDHYDDHYTKDTHYYAGSLHTNGLLLLLMVAALRRYRSAWGRWRARAD